MSEELKVPISYIEERQNHPDYDDPIPVLVGYLVLTPEVIAILRKALNNE